ncbi:MAG: hypothetical protein JSR90_06880 [Proteobacteria bacterium]|nr:hypothetical protein [Pseudomonadota bacterium]
MTPPSLLRSRWVAVAYNVALFVLMLAGIEYLASFYAPAWPARALRTIPPVNADPDKPFNSWGMYDRERTLAKPPGVRFRSVFVGDSFVEFDPDGRTLTRAVEERVAADGQGGFEAVGLGISGTGPRSYYYRTRDVALSLSPDALFVFFVSGNDFMPSGGGQHDGWLPPLVDESPGGSLLGRIMPRTDWMLVNRLRLSEFLRGNKPIPHEGDRLQAILEGPADQRIPALVEHLRKYYFPHLDRDRLTEIVGRGGPDFWATFDKHAPGGEALPGWLLNLVVSAEIRDDDQTRIRTPGDAEKAVKDSEIEATASWLEGIHALAEAHHVPMHLFLIPVASMSPDFTAFWKPWPRYFSWYLLSDARHQRLARVLARTTVPFTDLRGDLLGVPHAFRLSDAHWNARGQTIAVGRIREQLRALGLR